MANGDQKDFTVVLRPIGYNDRIPIGNISAISDTDAINQAKEAANDGYGYAKWEVLKVTSREY